MNFRLAVILLAFLASYTHAEDAPPSDAGKREPAQVMSFHGAEWLERAEREQEEQPDKVMAAMELKPGMTVADIGTGTGYFARRIAKVVGSTGTVYGVDIQPEMLDYLKQYSERDGVGEIVKPVLGGEISTRLPEACADWMILVDVYHEFQHPEPMLASMRRALKDDGKIALIEYRLDGDTAKHIKAEHRMSIKQVLSEWQPAGFELVDMLDFLPAQRIFIFQKRAVCDK